VDAHEFWRLLHLATFVYWLGADLGVFYSSRFVINSAYTPETRAVLLKTLVWLDMVPRYALLLTLPVGLQLAGGLGLSPLSSGWLWLVWLGFAAWIVLAFQIHRRQGSDVVKALTNIDLALRFALILMLALSAILSLSGSDIFGTPWLALKVLLFAGAVACGVMIRITFRPFEPAFGEIMKNGSTPEVETRLRASLNSAARWVVLLWIVVAAAAYVGITQPGL